MLIEERKERVDFITSVVANKELTNWCVVDVEWKWKMVILEWGIDVCEAFIKKDNAIYTEVKDKSSLYNVVAPIIKNYWHPVMIGDVIAYIEELRNHIFMSFPWDPRDLPDDYLSEMDDGINKIIEEWDYKRYDITHQSDECIECVYNIIRG